MELTWHDHSYALLFSSRGANVVVNDFNGAAAQKVVDEITRGSTMVPVRHLWLMLIPILPSWRKGSR